MKPIVYTGGTFAAINSGKYSCYYGENEVDPVSGEWKFVMFQNKTNGLQKEVFSATNSQLLEVANGEGPVDMLIAGLALYLAK